MKSAFRHGTIGEIWENNVEESKKQWYELFSDRPELEIFEQMMSWENDEGKVQ